MPFLKFNYPNQIGVNPTSNKEKGIHIIKIILTDINPAPLSKTYLLTIKINENSKKKETLDVTLGINQSGEISLDSFNPN